ncbi:sensor histidine kinase [Streptomyces sp. DSM 41972]|uniref:histidine kinase n=1 Tax=Streptomyces althioticus subsp. attaecolombicae TaxID=3075534 RepID=A0ABU3I064_9ACTN|nr:sensor histidine kinase [Streptomyces sp. DSM 41972]SCD81773.1 Signal transduction histidine kinase [Streptomyces sp. di50b]SCD98261.1 Signal transduction histidine kinase [Streptomyces sp. di188]
MSAKPSPLLSWHLRPAARAALAWCGAIAYPFVLFFAARGTPFDSPGLPFVSAAAVTVLPLGLLRRRPLPALALMLLGTYVTATTTPFWQVVYLLVLANDLAAGYAVATRPRLIAVTAAVTTLGVQVAFAARLGTGTDGFARTVVVLVLALAAAWMTGHSVRERREHAAALRSQTAAQAVAAERLRIARELHDMIAHSIGVIAIQAGVGRRVIDTQPDEARNALATIEDTSRETLAGLRRTLGALRRTAPGPGTEAPPREPAPGLADLDRLTASTKDAGVHADVRWLGERRPLPPDIDLAAFRIVQEALTNVVRHADTPDCRVTIGYQDGELTIEVADDGRGGPASGIGYGITGMRERVSLLRGQFTAGPRPEGGFRVAARLPLPEGVHIS